MELSSSIVEALGNGKISRREALARLIDSGLTIRESFEAMGEFSNKSAQPEVTYTMDDIAEFSKKMQALTAHPEVIADVKRIEETEEEDMRVFEAQEFIEKWRNPEKLKEVGLDLPDFRLSLRVFENPSVTNLGQDRILATTEPAEVAFLNDEVIGANRWTICGSVGMVVCGSIGKELQR